MTKNSKIILTTIAITAIASLFGATSFFSTSALAVQQTTQEGPNGDGETKDAVESSTSDSSGDKMPVITGSVNVGDTIKNYINANKKVSFVDAATSAEKQVQNGSVVEGDLDVKQGYLVYTFSVIDTKSDTSYEIIIDAGNGHVLNKSAGMPLESHRFGEHGMHGFEED
jgi:uncharacterized membrane protein YkoI